MNLRLVAKRAVQAVAITVAAPAAVLCGFGRISRMFLMFGHCFALVPGFPGDLLRSGFYYLTLRNSSPDTVIAFGTFFSRSTASLGPNVSVGSYCIIGFADIGARTQISSHVEIPSGRHQHNRGADGRFVDSVDSRVTIGSDCWIGASAIILADVGAGSTIGAGSVVVKPVPPGSVAVGNPARVVRTVEPSGAGMENR